MTDTHTGPAGFRVERVTVRDLLSDVLSPLSVTAQAKQVALETHLDPEVSTVVADRHKLVQVLHRLVSNAIRFTPAGGRVTVSTRRIGTPEGKEAEIAIADTGIGIRAADLARIFHGFEQVDPSSTRKYGGAGLGLALVRRLVELHGGRVWAESEGEGQGARFIVRLPLLVSPPTPRILVVEDEAPVLEGLCASLKSTGCVIEQAASGTQALVALAAQPPDVLVLDIGLPDVDGWEVLKQVRRSVWTRDLPVLILTGLGSTHANQALALGADEFLTKPVSTQVLVQTVSRLLTGGWRETAGARGRTPQGQPEPD